MFPGNMRGWEILVLVALVVLLFGAKRLPDAARGLGRSLRIFKSETKGLVDSGEEPSPEAIETKREGGTEASGVSETTEAPERSRSDG